MKLTAAQKLPIYRATLARYERDGDRNTEVQRRMVAQLQIEVEREKNEPIKKRRK